MGKNPQLKTLQDFIFTNLMRLSSHKTYAHSTSDHDEFHPSPSLVPLPSHLATKSIKNHLPVDRYSMIKLRSPAHEGDENADHSCCAVCLSSIEEWHNVRELGNCVHVFHVECLDGWLDHGRETCPVCRAELLPGRGEELGPGKDPWRSERMVYLFGEDCAMDELKSNCWLS